MPIPEIRFRGARPLREEDDLVGRERETSELCNRCESYDIVQITAPSGVGKTSFVQAGGKVALRSRGFFIPQMAAWSDRLGHPSLREGNRTPDEFAEVLYRLVIGLPDDQLEPNGEHIADVVAGVAGDRKMVVILDQMEELLRFQAAAGASLLRLAGTAARESGVPHVVIARSEYRDALRPIEVRGATVWPLFIQEITSPAAIEDIINGPVHAVGATIEPDATAKIRRWWEDARSATLAARGAATLGAVGLLHLQSLLWSFEQWGRSSEEFDIISVAALDAFAESRLQALGADSSDDAFTGASLIRDAIFNYVDERVTQATARPVVKRGHAERTLDWSNGPRVMLARVAPALSSGGYKVPQALSSLLPLALGDELTQTGARALADALRAGTRVEDFDGRDTRLEGAGLAAGWDKSRLLRELVDALDSILQALSDEDADILRKFDLTDETVYELVHDGVGPALTRWSLDFLERPLSAVGVIAAQRGGAFRHSLSPATFLGPDGSVEPHWGAVVIGPGASGDPVATLDNLQWALNIIDAPDPSARLTMQDLVFRGCDFTGSAFVGCTFRNVVFESCSLKGTVMIGCGFDGVEFRTGAGPRDQLNLLTIKHPTAGSDVTFADLNGTMGLFLEVVSSGTWLLRNCRLSHLVVTAADDGQPAAVLELEMTTASQVTLGARIDVVGDGEASELGNVSRVGLP